MKETKTPLMFISQTSAVSGEGLVSINQIQEVLVKIYLCIKQKIYMILSF